MADSRQSTVYSRRKKKESKGKICWLLAVGCWLLAVGCRLLRQVGSQGVDHPRGKQGARGDLTISMRLPRSEPVEGLLRNSSLVSPPSTGGDKGEGE